MSKRRLAGFPAALFLAGLGLSLYYADAWWRLPEYSEEDIVASVQLNLVMDLRQQGRATSGLDAAQLAVRRAQLEQELRDEIQREQRDAQRGLVAGLAALLLSLGQLFWFRQLNR